MVQMVYRVDVTIGTATYTGWWISRTLNENTYDRIRFNNAIKAKTAISASRLIVGDSGGFFHLAAGSVFDVDKPILWAVSAITAAATGTNNYLSYPSCTLRNNAGSTWTATQYETLYLAGTLEGSVFTGNMPSNLNKTGAFTELTGSKYQSQSTYLGRGDILVTKTSGHTVVVLTNGSKYEGTIHSVEYALGDRVIKYGCEGQDVKLMQEMLLKLGYDLGAWGCDGDFGDCTELALKAFQADAKLDVDGECGPTTLIALEKAVEAHDGVKPTGKIVRISGGNCYIRTAPNTDGKKLGVAHKGDELPFAGEVSDNGWLQVLYKDQKAWVSGKYGRTE